MSTISLIPCTSQEGFPNLGNSFGRIRRFLRGLQLFVRNQSYRSRRKIVVKIKISLYER